jgi:hypothetical protein
VIFFPANAVSPVKRNKRLPCHLPRVNEVRLGNVVGHVGNVVGRGVSVVGARKGESVNREGSDLHVHKGNGLRGHRESARRESVRRENDHRVVSGLLAHHAHKGSVQRELDELNVLLKGLKSFQRLSQSLRLRCQQFQRLKPSLKFKCQQFRRFRRLMCRRLRRHRHLHQMKALVRASRGGSKPCYWHRHDISTASNIAVA